VSYAKEKEMIGAKPDSPKGKGVAKTILDDKDKYQFLYNSAPVGLYRSSISDGRILECNEYLAHMFGYLSREEFISKFVFADNYVHLEERNTLLSALIRDGKLNDGVAQLRRRDGQNIWIKFSAIIYPEIGYVEGVASDITKQILAEEQVRKYSQAIEQNPATIVITNTEGNIEYVNSKFTELTGYTFYEAMGQNPRILKSGETSAEEYHKLWETLKSGNVWKGEFHNRKKNGELFWESATIGPIKDEKGRITHFLAIKEDINEQKRIEDELRQSEKEFMDVLHAAGDAILLIDGDTFVDCNEATAQMLGYANRADFLMTHPSKLSPPLQPDGRSSFEKANEMIQTAVENGFHRFEWIHRKANGEDFPVEVSLTPVIHRGKKTIHCVWRDITERRRAEELLRRSEMKFRTLYDSTSDAVMLAEEKGFIDCNKAALTIFGCPTREEFCSKHPGDVSPPNQSCGTDSMTLSNEKIRGAMENGSNHFEWMHKRIDTGEIFPADVLLNALELDGKPVVQAVVRDITERKRAEAVLARTIARFTAMIDTVHAELYLKSRDNTYIAVNRAFASNTGLQPKQIIGKRDHEIFPATEADKYSASDEEIMENNVEVINKLEEIRDSDGKVRWMEYTKTPLVDPEGTVTGIVGMIRDVTALYLSRQQLAQADKLAAIGTLAAGVAHEINNPIGYINSNLNTLAKYAQKVKAYYEKNASPESEEWQEIGEIMDDCRSAISESLEGTSRVKKIVMDLKSFSRIDRAEKEFANINEGIESTLNIVWNELKYKCKVEKQLGQLPELFCMPNQLNQVFMNLLVNAGQAIAGEGIITIRTWADQVNIFISFRDNGGGIPKENLNKIFEAFFTTKEVGKGTGLGLSLVYDIIKKHNGKIEVDSTVGAGTEFVITLPIEGGVSG
jgi:PAS domain S-box-containing protein